jgi:hypothetical protein
VPCSALLRGWQWQAVYAARHNGASWDQIPTALNAIAEQARSDYLAAVQSQKRPGPATSSLNTRSSSRRAAKLTSLSVKAAPSAPRAWPPAPRPWPPAPFLRAGGRAAGQGVDGRTPRMVSPRKDA